MEEQNPNPDKVALLDHLKQLITRRISEAERSIKTTREARDSDTKSTAGDKHEVGRAMVQIELDKQEAQLVKNRLLADQLEKVRLDREQEEIGFGSMIKTDKGLYFISIGLGQVHFDETTYFVISRESPIGQLMDGRQVGDYIKFNDRELKILSIS